MTGAEVVAAIGLVRVVVGAINEAVDSLRERGELTPELEAKIDTELSETFARKHWQKRPAA